MATNKYFVCPYCNKKFTREDLVIHLRNKHTDILPEGFSPLRTAFHIVNGRDFNYARRCRVCKKSTNWDESKGRYDFMCGSKSCHDKYVEIMRENMGEKCGINRQTKTAEGLKKMLANRRISGKYKFQDGTEVDYTGSYERKALEFFDNVLEIKSADLMIPGPVLSYELDGIKHFYIPDMFYIPYNLIIEVKDGGDRPNKNPQWSDTRKKQIAKEEYIIKHTDFNYLRLTNNDFSQILSVFADLKMSLKEFNSERIIHVNESMVSAVHGAIPLIEDEDLVLVQYLQNNVFANETKFGISNTPKLDEIFIRDDFDFTVKKVNKTFLDECKYSVYIIKDKKSNILSKIKESLGRETNEDFITETVLGHKLYTDDQLQFESSIIPYEDFYYNSQKIEENCLKYILDEEIEVKTDGQ